MHVAMLVTLPACHVDLTGTTTAKLRQPKSVPAGLLEVHYLRAPCTIPNALPDTNTSDCALIVIAQGVRKRLS